jgi:hypothetical protein
MTNWDKQEWKKMTSKDNECYSRFQGRFSNIKEISSAVNHSNFLSPSSKYLQEGQDRGQPRPWFHGSPLFAGRPQTSHVPMFEGIIVSHGLFKQNIHTSPEKNLH